MGSCSSPAIRSGPAASNTTRCSYSSPAAGSWNASTSVSELGLSIRVAKIGTYLDQVVDVFYVTDRSGEKITDGPRLAEIRRTLLDMLS